MEQQLLHLLRDNKTLAQLCEIYHESTGMFVSYYYPGDDDEARIDFYPQEKSEYCRLVQSAPGGLARCRTCDREGLARAWRKGSYHIYHCHAGLVDVVIPIDHQGREMGSFWTGQVILEEPGLKKLRALYAHLAIPKVSFERFAAAFATVKVVDQGRLLFYVRLLHLIASYIVKTENEIRLQRQIVLKDRELHRREMEKAHREKTLKDLSISVLGGGRRNHPSAEAGRSAGTSGRQIVEKARAFIETHYSQDITLEDVARAVFLSPNYFSSLFKRVTGASFRSSLVERRFQAAREMLAAATLPIKEVVARAGFRDYNYFNRTFRAMEGVPPAEFRARRRGRAVT